MPFEFTIRNQTALFDLDRRQGAKSGLSSCHDLVEFFDEYVFPSYHRSGPPSVLSEPVI